jgi:hypothetical protein
MLPSSPPQALSFAEPKGKEVTSLEKVLVHEFGRYNLLLSKTQMTNRKP